MKKMRERTLSKRILLAVLSVVLTSFLLLTVVFFYWNYQQMNREYTQFLQANMSNVNRDFSRHMETVRSFAEKHYSSYEGTQLRFSSSYDVSKNTKLITDVREQMEPFYHSMLILNKNGMVTFDCRNGISFSESLWERVEELASGQKLGARPFLWSISNRYSGQSDIQMLSLFLQEAVAGEMHYAGAVVVNIDTAFLSKNLFGDSPQNNVETYILDQTGRVAVCSDLSKLGQDLSSQPYIQEILGKANGEGRAKIDGKQVNLLYRKTDFTGFYVVVQSPYSRGAFDVSGLLPVSLLFLDFLVSIVLIYLLCQRVFRPFNDVTEHMREGFAEEYNISKIYDDVQFLERYHQLTENYKRKLLLQNEQNLIIKSLLQDGWSQEMQRFLIDKNLIRPGKPYCVVILQISMGGEILEENIDVCLQRRADVEKIVSGHGSQCTCLELGLRKLLLIMDSPEETRVLQKLEHIKAEANRSFGIEVQYTVSDICSNKTCDALYRQAKERLEALSVEKQDSGSNKEKAQIATHTKHELLEQVIDYLNNNYQDCDITVSSLADRFYISSSYLGKLFQAFTGKSILSYLQDIRMKKARDLLMTCPEMSVSQVSRAVGFSSNAYFTNSFRKYFGVSPSKIWELNFEGASEDNKGRMEE